MKFIITESRLTEILQKFVDKLKYDEVCEFIVDPEPDENNDIWVYAVISEDWYFSEGDYTTRNVVAVSTAVVNNIRKEVREMISKVIGLNVRVISYVKKCK